MLAILAILTAAVVDLSPALPGLRQGAHITVGGRDVPEMGMVLRVVSVGIAM
ncbi:MULTISPECIES: hypothetical protein [Pseudarthrobacter]|uniref:Uncharacterized protein n=1 Tax=Pseudarthrobacter enclensis TaxID=993070 RepID=A0ABT9RW89_9MICC|nr:hypothetical protein [Pseudarthrobacter enclensis]MDP9889504.1 hypothetical protein [Pseudarthrobacter enclensis]